jgi:hypothetical protein
MIKTLFSKQKWLIQSLPNSKMESDDLVRELLFLILVDHVENKRLLERFPWDLDEGSQKLKSQIENAYSWIKEKRPLLENKIEQLEVDFPSVPEDENLWKFVNENHIGDIIAAQQTLREKDQTVLKTIIDFREHLIEL